MADNNVIKKYSPKDIRSPFLGVVFLLIIYVGIKIIFTGYSQLPLEKYLAFSIGMFSGICVSIYLLYANFMHCLYIETSGIYVSGMNRLKVKRGTLKFKEINVIRITFRRVS